MEGVLITRKTQAEDVLLKGRGCAKLPLGLNVDEYLKLVRG